MFLRNRVAEKKKKKEKQVKRDKVVYLALRARVSLDSFQRCTVCNVCVLYVVQENLDP